jgi:methyltransferase (TIGR00027 family)
VAEVTDTAGAIARVRADEAALPPAERLFADPFASLFAAGAGADAVLEIFSTVPFFRESVRLRTRFIDDFLHRGLTDGLCQVVLLGAGFDCRALRMPELGTGDRLVFEVDFPSQIEGKRQTLRHASVAIPPSVRFVACDLSSPDFAGQLARDLAANGFRPGAGALVVWEGVVGYLDIEAIERTLGFVAQTGGPGTRLVFNYNRYRFPPKEIAERVSATGFATLEDEGMDSLYRRYLPGEPPAGGDGFRIAVARVAPIAAA